MKVVFMGTPDFAVPTLEKLYNSKHQIVTVVTQPDKPTGRKQILTPSPVKSVALNLGLPVFQPQSVNTKDSRQYLKELGADIAVVLAFGQILRPRVLNTFPHGCLNVHGSILPRYRGAAPIQRAVMSGENMTGVSIMKMDEGLDTGRVILIDEIPIGPNDTAGDVFDKLAVIGAEGMVKALEQVESGTVQYHPQNIDDPSASYAHKITEDDTPIDWGWSAERIHNLVRGLNPTPGACTELNGLRLKVWSTRLAENPMDASISDPSSGLLLKLSKSGVLVQTGNGIVELLEVQPSGGKRMAAADFARGKRLEPCKVCFCHPQTR